HGRTNGVVPLAVELGAMKIHGRRFIVGDFDYGGGVGFVYWFSADSPGWGCARHSSGCSWPPTPRRRSSILVGICRDFACRRKAKSWPRSFFTAAMTRSSKNFIRFSSRSRITARKSESGRYLTCQDRHYAARIPAADRITL